MNITILGAGAWGTAMTIPLSVRHNVVLWGRNADTMAAMAASRTATGLPGITLPAQLQVTSDFEQAVAHVSHPDVPSLLIIGSSVSGLRNLCDKLQHRPIPNIVWLCKGMEEHTRLLPHQIVASILGDTVPAGVLSGPSFAIEVAKGLPCALTIASGDEHLRTLVTDAAHGDTIRIYSSDDVVGVEIGGAVKNILAIATGAADGMQLGLNARAALITRGLAEITRLGIAMGGKAETFMGLSGMGDLILTCTGDLSRNRRVGLALAAGKQLDAIVAELGQVAEGVRCAKEVRSLSQEMGVSMPITHAIASVLFDKLPLDKTIKQLMTRVPREEVR